MTPRLTDPFASPAPFRFSIIGVTCLCSFALLASVVAGGNGPYGFEDPVFSWLGAPSTTASWAQLSEFLGTPLIVAALLMSAALGVARRGLVRVIVFAAIAGAAFLVSEHVAKPLVQRSYYGELTFPSGSVTAVSATALAMWLALHPLLGRKGRVVLSVLGGAWTLLTALAVVGALWHTPLDDLGSLLLSAGIVASGAGILEYVANRKARLGTRTGKVGGRSA